jgi:hypothetical protein
VALWDALFGAHPFQIASGDREIGAAELVRRIAAGPIAPASHRVPPAIVAALRRALAIAPDARWPTLAELLDQISPRASPRRKALVAGLVLAGAAIVVVGLIARDAATHGDDAASPTADRAADRATSDDVAPSVREAREFIAKQAALIAAGDAGALRPTFTKRLQARITEATVAKARASGVGAMPIDDLVGAVAVGNGALKITMKSGRTLTRLVKVDDVWQADTIWFK